MMKVAFRADASLQIGTGHVMRCLTLADAISVRGGTCHFLCRAHEGNLIDFIRSKGHSVSTLPFFPTAGAAKSATDLGHDMVSLAHHHWLGATQGQDIDACAPILETLRPDWLIVDHYAIDARWERALTSHYSKLMVIDDLADRSHACDLLLDQTFGRDAVDYRPFVPAGCHLLCGSHYALLRPEFAALRPYSLQRRAQPTLRELLITMGGVDKDNATEQVLQGLRTCSLPADSRITVVMGETAPRLGLIHAKAQDMPWPTRVLVGISDMAQLMADSDLAIGAAGSTSWERCCLGLPTIMLVVADNQMKVAKGLERIGAAVPLVTAAQGPKYLTNSLARLLKDPAKLLDMTSSAASIVNGMGVSSVMTHLEA